MVQDLVEPDDIPRRQAIVLEMLNTMPPEERNVTASHGSTDGQSRRSRGVGNSTVIDRWRILP